MSCEADENPAAALNLFKEGETVWFRRFGNLKTVTIESSGPEGYSVYWSLRDNSRVYLHAVPELWLCRIRRSGRRRTVA